MGKKETCVYTRASQSFPVAAPLLVLWLTEPSPLAVSFCGRAQDGSQPQTVPGFKTGWRRRGRVVLPPH